MTTFASYIWSALLYERGAQATRHPTVAGRRQEQPTVADRLALGAVRSLLNQNARRFVGESVSQGSEFALVALTSDCTLRDSAAMLSRNSQRTDSSCRSLLVVDGMVGPRGVRIASGLCDLRDTSSSLLSICCSRSRMLGQTFGGRTVPSLLRGLVRALPSDMSSIAMCALRGESTSDAGSAM